MPEVKRAGGDREIYPSEALMRSKESSEGTVILVKRWDLQGEVDYITWVVDGEGNRLWGHSFLDPRDALEDFKDRF